MGAYKSDWVRAKEKREMEARLNRIQVERANAPRASTKQVNYARGLAEQTKAIEQNLVQAIAPWFIREHVTVFEDLTMTEMSKAISMLLAMREDLEA